MPKARTINIKQLHDKTGEHVRAAGRMRHPIQVTDRGKVVAVIGSPQSAPAPGPRRRRILPDYAALLAAGTGSPTVLDDLSAVRGDR